MEKELELLDLFKILLRFKWLIILLLVVTVVAVYVANEFMTEVFEAQSTVLVKESRMAMPFDGMAYGRDSVSNYVEILKSRSMAEKVAQRAFPANEITPGLVRGIQSRLSVTTVGQTDVIRISITSEDEDEAQLLANTYVDVFIEDSREVNQMEARSAREFIETQLAIVDGDLQDAERRLLAYKTEEDIFYPSEETKKLLDRIGDMEKQRAELTIGMMELDTKLAETYRQLEAQDEEVVSSKTIRDNPVMANFRSRLTELEMELSAALERYTERHPTVISLKAEIEDVTNRMEQEVEEIVGSQTVTTNPIRQSLLSSVIQWETSQSAMASRLEALNQALGDLEGDLGKLPQKELDLARLMREQQVAESIYIMLMERHEEIRITEAMETSDIRMIDPAARPTSPIQPRKRLNLAIGAVLALFVGCGLAFFIDYMDTTIKTPEDVEEILGVPVMGLIPTIDDRNGRRGKRKRKPGASSGVNLKQ